MDSLLFVYNASSGFWNKKIDFAHKILSPNTYECSLCALTHGNFGETDRWRSFRASQKTPMKFIYKNEFETQFPDIKVSYPVIFAVTSNGLKMVLSSKKLKELSSLDELIAVLDRNK
ncbi:hypothetical protein [Aquimarina agarilytica]|uniref:hypothetical protein n=1 Tax=Aquimarina agarilytica TaxID=1087449 RepID=UPI00028A412D|nr:hypothetical protein [Aquimarina agarilytica]